MLVFHFLYFICFASFKMYSMHLKMCILLKTVFREADIIIFERLEISGACTAFRKENISSFVLQSNVNTVDFFLQLRIQRKYVLYFSNIKIRSDFFKMMEEYSKGLVLPELKRRVLLSPSSREV